MGDINLETATVAELKAWKKTVDWDTAPDGAIDQLNDLIVERMVEERVGASVAKAAEQTKAQQRDEAAKRRWPELRDEKSEFYKLTQELLPEFGNLIAAANEAGLRKYGSPSGKVPPMSGLASGRSEGAPGGGYGVDEGNDFVERTSPLRKLLEGEGLLKVTPEALQRITANAAVTAANVEVE
jgi:hypothetical protein